MSGGQKVKVVLAAAMWNQPHICILDEPTNFLDRESLGALADAIKEFQGGVVIISHNAQFCSTLCPETWVLERGEDNIGRMNVQGDADWMHNVVKDKAADAVTFQQAEEMMDAYGNVTKVKEKKGKMSAKEKKAFVKKVKQKIADGLDLDSEEENFALENNL